MAVEKDDPELVRVLLKAGVRADTTGLLDRTLLHEAQSSTVARELIKRGIPLNARDSIDGMTALHVAARHDRGDVVRELIRAHADIDARDRNGDSPLHLAVQRCNQQSTELLLRAHASVAAANSSGRTPLFEASRSGRSDIMGLLIASGAEAKARDRNQATPLHYSAQSRNPETVRLLLQSGADANSRDELGRTPLHWLARELREMMADECVKEPHDLASRQGDIARMLVVSGADVSATDGDSATPLHYSVDSCVPAVAEVLIRSGADPNTRDGQGRTPLHWAARGWKTETVSLLIASSADVNARDSNGYTPLHAALCEYYKAQKDDSRAKAGEPAVLELLRGGGARLSTKEQGEITRLRKQALWRERRNRLSHGFMGWIVEETVPALICIVLPLLYVVAAVFLRLWLAHAQPSSAVLVTWGMVGYGCLGLLAGGWVAFTIFLVQLGRSRGYAFGGGSLTSIITPGCFLGVPIGLSLGYILGRPAYASSVWYYTPVATLGALLLAIAIPTVRALLL
ncbi:MAG: hypothetical protein A2V77_10105 [Anaeromyxobacter sp. RBG_16_69_14]|nr:MAG: hypothetical protein A2V77_10105 [Anaeromyxobacter sp. RBG_16_69_14]